MLRERLEPSPLLEWQRALPASVEQLKRVHACDYVDGMLAGTISMRAIGLPWSDGLIQRSLGSVGATLAACRTALARGRAASLAGGTHHAFADRGEGFCVFNDVVVALHELRREGLLQRAAVVDLDVHQGNGTARMLADEPDFFTFSQHGANNFPFRKENSDLDVALPNGTEDEAYLAALGPALRQALDRPVDLVVYLAGADPYRDDRFGLLGLSAAGLEARDRMVYAACRQRELPVALVMAGGYARRIEETVAIQARSVTLLAEGG